MRSRASRSMARHSATITKAPIKRSRPSSIASSNPARSRSPTSLPPSPSIRPPRRSIWSSQHPGAAPTASNGGARLAAAESTPTGRRSKIGAPRCASPWSGSRMKCTGSTTARVAICPGDRGPFSRPPEPPGPSGATRTPRGSSRWSEECCAPCPRAVGSLTTSPASRAVRCSATPRTRSRSPAPRAPDSRRGSSHSLATRAATIPPQGARLTCFAAPSSQRRRDRTPAVRVWPAPASASGEFRPRHGRSRARRLPADHGARDRGRLLPADAPRLRSAVRVAGTARHRVELLLAGFDEPILAALPRPDRLEQIGRMREYLKRRFGVDASGLWLTERVWQPELAGDLAEAGVEYALVDDRHFLASGFRHDELHRPHHTESDGQRVGLLAIDERLRYLIPFRPPEETAAYLKQLRAQGHGLAVLADDGEKFGGWPG